MPLKQSHKGQLQQQENKENKKQHLAMTYNIVTNSIGKNLTHSNQVPLFCQQRWLQSDIIWFAL